MAPSLFELFLGETWRKGLETGAGGSDRSVGVSMVSAESISNSLDNNL